MTKNFFVTVNDSYYHNDITMTSTLFRRIKYFINLDIKNDEYRDFKDSEITFTVTIWFGTSTSTRQK